MKVDGEIRCRLDTLRGAGFSMRYVIVMIDFEMRGSSHSYLKVTKGMRKNNDAPFAISLIRGAVV